MSVVVRVSPPAMKARRQALCNRPRPSAGLAGLLRKLAGIARYLARRAPAKSTYVILIASAGLSGIVRNPYLIAPAADAKKRSIGFGAVRQGKGEQWSG